MDIKATKLELVKSILEIKEESILNLLSSILSDSKVVAYSVKGEPFTPEEYKNHINDISMRVEEEKRTYTTDEVRKNILKK